jgi:putative PIN family toxin of toxin-antitoxin system
LLRLVIDTNVLISSFFGGNPKKVIDLWREGRAILCVTQGVLEEYLRVIARLPIAPESKNKLVAILQEKSNIELVNPSRHYSVIREDPEDNKFIDCAVEAQADYIISGDAHLLQVKAYRDIAIYSPKDFLQMIINP